MSISVKLLETTKEIEQKINAAIADQLNDVLAKNLSHIQTELIYGYIPSWIDDQPEIQALIRGELSGPFGTTLSTLAIAGGISDAICQSTRVSFQKYNSKLNGGGLEITIQPRDFSNVLSLPQGHTIYEGGDLHWLEWMLMRGDETIIVGYEYNPRTGLGRTGLGNMIKGRTFRVPPQYSGTADNNFITRALIGQRQNDDITKLLKKVLGV
jgi:hypothetical protein